MGLLSMYLGWDYTSYSSSYLITLGSQSHDPFSIIRRLHVLSGPEPTVLVTLIVTGPCN